jgi:hypothetical protein
VRRKREYRKRNKINICQKTSDVLEVKAVEACVPGMVATDVGGINEKSLISCFFMAKI